MENKEAEILLGNLKKESGTVKMSLIGFVFFVLLLIYYIVALAEMNDIVGSVLVFGAAMSGVNYRFARNVKSEAKILEMLIELRKDKAES